MNLRQNLKTITHKYKTLTDQYKKWLYIILFVVLILIPVFVHNKYVLHVLISTGIYIVLTLILNLFTGYAGQFAL